MKFVRRDNKEYEVLFSKEKAIKELKKDSRVKKITKILKGIAIHTNPIIPYITNTKLAKFPIGTYTISVRKLTKALTIRIKRKEGMVRYTRSYPTLHHYHIRNTFAHSGICWGNVCNEIGTICRKCDWYWAVKRSLDLLMDSKSESDDYYYWTSLMKTLEENYKKFHNIK